MWKLFKMHSEIGETSGISFSFISLNTWKQHLCELICELIQYATNICCSRLFLFRKSKKQQLQLKCKKKCIHREKWHWQMSQPKVETHPFQPKTHYAVGHCQPTVRINGWKRTIFSYRLGHFPMSVICVHTSNFSTEYCVLNLCQINPSIIISL